jgi:hypothetical protein
MMDQTSFGGVFALDRDRRGRYATLANPGGFIAVALKDIAQLKLERGARTVAAVFMVLLAAALLRNGIAGLT